MTIGRTSGPSGTAGLGGADRTSGTGKFGAFKAALGTAADKVASFFRGLGSGPAMHAMNDPDKPVPVDYKTVNYDDPKSIIKNWGM